LHPVKIAGFANYLEAGFWLAADKGRIKDLLGTKKPGTERKQDQNKESVPHTQTSSSSYNFFIYLPSQPNKQLHPAFRKFGTT